MNSVMVKIGKDGKNIVEDNNFLFSAFQNRLILRLIHIFEKYNIPINKNILKKNIEENLINNLMDINADIIPKYVNMLGKYENIINTYVGKNTETTIIKKATMSFIERINDKNSQLLKYNISNNFIEWIKSIIYVYDNNELNNEILKRISTDVKEIIDEFNRNNYNFVINSINDIIKNIISNIK